MAGSSPRYPYPSHVCAPNFVTVKLNGRDTYDIWNIQIVCLLKSHDMFRFIDENPPTEGEENNGDRLLWRRSDALVKGWILGSLCEQPLKCVIKTNKDFTSKDLWDKLKTIYGPVLQHAVATESITEEESKERKEILETLYEATRSQNYKKVLSILNKGEVSVKDKITINGNTVIHLAVGTTKKRDDLEKLMLNIVPQGEANSILDMKNFDGSTPLHVAAILGNTEAAMMLVEKKADLLFTKDKEGRTPLARALSNMHTDTYIGLLNFIANTNNDIERATTSTNTSDIERATQGTSGDELLLNAISSRDYKSALRLINTRYTNIRKDVALMAVAQNFPRKLNIWERVISKLFTDPEEKNAVMLYSLIDMWFMLIMLGLFPYILVFNLLVRIIRIEYDLLRYLLSSRMYERLQLINSRLLHNLRTSRVYQRLQRFNTRSNNLPPSRTYELLQRINRRLLHNWRTSRIFNPFNSIITLPLEFKPFKEEHSMHSDARDLLKAICNLIKASVDGRPYRDYYNDAILEASRQNAYEVVVMIVSYFPNAIWSTNEDGHNIIQYAVINRSEKVYNLLYQMSEHKNIYRTIKDPLGNNLLHLAAKLAPAEKLSHLSGPAWQIQNELQWFKEVKGFVCPLNIIQKNCFEETPEMVFTREHKELVIEGEKWMKEAARSYTITAALIATIVFAAAIKVPGGDNKENGIPVFTNKPAFRVFAISNAISFFTSVTSLIMFLSILTARFSEKDFLFKLPNQLIIGLATLFISTTAMLIAFGATLFLVFGQDNRWILVPIGVLILLPITSFANLQFPLIKDLLSSTYGRSIFGKQNGRPFY